MGLVGESGSGKSTLARTIAGGTGRGLAGDDVTQIVGGSLHVLGVELRGMHARRRNLLTFDVGYLPQNAGRMLTPGYTIAENVAEPLLARDRRADRKELGSRVAELIDAVQLPLKVMSAYPHEISSGQRQRVAIARSLVLGPALWVADEPTAGVDVTARGPVLDTILEMQSEHDFSALIVSHEAAVTARLTDRIAVLQRGHLVGLGRLDEVLRDPSHPYVRGLAQEYRIATGPIELPDLTGDDAP
jgi:ABC-type glutathione transport system ATPase component